MEHGNKGIAQSTTEETNNSKKEQSPEQAVTQQEMLLILSMPQITGMRIPTGSIKRESQLHAEDKCPPFSLEIGLMTGSQSDREIGSGDNMKGSSSLSSSQESNPQLSISELNRTQDLKEEAQKSKEEEISIQTESRLELSLFLPMHTIIGKMTSRGIVRAVPYSKCMLFPVIPGCSSGLQSDTEKGSGDTLQTAASSLDNTTKSKENDNIEEGEKTLSEESVILTFDPVTEIEPKKEIETCATQTEEVSTPLVFHKAVQIPEEATLKSQDPRNELQSLDPFWSIPNLSGLIEKKEKQRQEEKKQVKLEKKEKKKLEKMEKIKEKENEKKQNEGQGKKEREKEERAKNGRVMGEKNTRKDGKSKEKEEKARKERVQEKESLKKEKHKEEKEKMKEKSKDEKEEKKKNIENSEEEREDKKKMIEAERLTLQKRLQLKGRMKGMKDSELWWPKEKKLIGKIAIQNFIQLLPSSSTTLKSPDIEDHVNRPKKRHMDLQEHLDQKFVGQKGKTNRKERKSKGRGNVSISEEEDQTEKNKIKRMDKKQKLGTVKVLRRRSICFQKMTLGDLHPLYTPRPYRIYVFTLEGTHTETTTISNGDRQYSLDPEEREKVTLEGRLMTQLVQKGKKTAIQETFPKVKEMSLNVPNRFHGCWMICQEGKNLNTFKKLQATYQQQLLKQRELTPDAENTDSKIWKESIKTTSLISNEEVIGAASKNLSPDEKRRNLSAHDLVRFGSRTLVGARIAREEDMGAVRAKKEKENKAIILTHNLVRFSSRTIVGAIKASAVTEWEKVSETQDEKKNISPFMNLKKSWNHVSNGHESDDPLVEVLIGFSLGNSLRDSLGI
ncbi:calponin homology domain-containing protein DDB_G0272472-like isoform X1 [Antechinus flavipes]|uniref:calponin homology domain-containing protein DDB_G0272472-like isoform X1 n=1 Tax=Antechinus flavipes TaxID=38775 RepID=UPI0022364203|nr:calponin homology domain-containing protein DDB_G0272472-like isoform X1 [Antechinus flavipes]